MVVGQRAQRDVSRLPSLELKNSNSKMAIFLKREWQTPLVTRRHVMSFESF
jgi:hypothetical protein